MTTSEGALAASVEAAVLRLMADPADVPSRAELEAASLPRLGEHDMSIGQLADFSGLGEHTLRYYEREGLVTVGRLAGGQRRYDPPAIQRVLLIARLRTSGMSVADLRELCALLDEHGQRDRRVRELLAAHRDRLRRRIAELQLALAITDYKLELGRLEPDAADDVPGSTTSPARRASRAPRARRPRR